MMRCAVYIQLIYVLRAICTQSVVIYYYVPIAVLSPCLWRDQRMRKLVGDVEDHGLRIITIILNFNN